jgi:predicted nucleic acid-binding protein
MTSKPPAKLVVDANPVISALLGGVALRAFLNPSLTELAIPEFTRDEVARYLPRLAAKVSVPEEILQLALALLPLTPYTRDSYAALLPEARKRIAKRDPNDVDLLALALMLEYPVWSNDHDFESTGVTVFTTACLIRLLERPGA